MLKTEMMARLLKTFEELDSEMQMNVWNDYAWDVRLDWVYDTVDTAVGFWKWDEESWCGDDLPYAIHVADIVQASKNYRYDDKYIREKNDVDGFGLIGSNDVADLIPRDKDGVPLYEKPEFKEYYKGWCIRVLNGERPTIKSH